MDNVMNKVGILVILLFLASMAAAANFEEMVDKSLAEVQGQTLPKPLGTLFGNEQINFHIALNSGGELIIGLITENKQIKSISAQPVPEPNLDVYTSEDTIKKLQMSSNPGLLLRKALDEGKITYKAVGFLNKIKYAFLSTFSNVAALFQDAEDGSFDELAESTKEEGFKVPEQPDAGVGATGAVVSETAAEEPAEETSESDEKSEITGGVAAEIEENQAKTHTVYLDDTGFNPTKIVVGVGDTVIWENIRTGSIDKAMVIGVRTCRDIKSKVLLPGETYSWTFNEAGDCIIVDGIMTTQSSRIIIGG